MAGAAQRAASQAPSDSSRVCANKFWARWTVSETPVLVQKLTKIFNQTLHFSLVFRAYMLEQLERCVKFRYLQCMEQALPVRLAHIAFPTVRQFRQHPVVIFNI